MLTNKLRGVRENPTLHEIHRGRISEHHAKSGYDYPAIRLPFTFSGLIGLSTRIYQTAHEGGACLPCCGLICRRSYKDECREIRKRHPAP
jgi:hypothetical protein